MDDFFNIVLLFLAGCAGGFLSGLLGVGGGIIFVPIYDYFLRKSGVTGTDVVSYTLADSLFSVMVSGFAGSITVFKNKMLDYKVFLPVSISAICSITLSTVFINSIEWYSPVKFKIFFSILLVYVLFKTIFYNARSTENDKMTTRLCVIAGLVTGTISGFSGVGGGIIMIPIFTIFGKMDIKKASILSLAVIPVLALPNLLINVFESPVTKLEYSTGYISWMLVLPVVAGVLSTIRLGFKTAKLLSVETIKAIFVGFIIISLINIIISIF
ncbi:MAG: sulfite exporter TauE/SafE family protein [Bacteroidetes bacterium]|nr:sulfite exporter TauE/SafE family protein [Bacteroidota bacterium]